MPSPNSKEHIYSVSEITLGIKAILEGAYPSVWVEGEIVDFKAHPSSGHYYFALKDDKAILKAAMFSYANRSVKFKIEDGQKVVCLGKIDVYGPRGQYQLICERIEPKGIGAQQLALEQLKKKLHAEGLFDPAHKRELPLMPFRVGLVTSASGAAVRDILQILKKGAFCVDVVIRSARVQGEGSAEEVGSAIEELNQYKEVDVIIISRGGGSTDDLWSFNEEVVARAIYNSKIPTISAVGHQINVTISDMVADVFVETPTAAAKIIVDKKNDLLAQIDGLRYELKINTSGIITELRERLIALQHALKSPLDSLLEKQQALDELSNQAREAVSRYVGTTRERFNFLVEKLEALSPLSVLSRGYSLSMLLATEEVVKDTSMVKRGDKVKTILKKGSFISMVEEVENER